MRAILISVVLMVPLLSGIASVVMADTVESPPVMRVAALK